MEDQKLENLLNLALSVPEDMRARSQELEIGYHKEDQTWELIVKYSGSLEPLREMGILTEEMHNEYAVLTVPEGMIETVSRLPQIESVSYTHLDVYKRQDIQGGRKIKCGVIWKYSLF